MSSLQFLNRLFLEELLICQKRRMIFFRRQVLLDKPQRLEDVLRPKPREFFCPCNPKFCLQDSGRVRRLKLFLQPAYSLPALSSCCPFRKNFLSSQSVLRLPLLYRRRLQEERKSTCIFPRMSLLPRRGAMLFESGGLPLRQEYCALLHNCPLRAFHLRVLRRHCCPFFFENRKEQDLQATKILDSPLKPLRCQDFSSLPGCLEICSGLRQARLQHSPAIFLRPLFLLHCSFPD